MFPRCFGAGFEAALDSSITSHKLSERISCADSSRDLFNMKAGLTCSH